jgi:hypothetical protein
LPQSEEKDRAGAFVLSVAYSGDGRRLACGTMNGTVAVFDTATATLLHTLPVRLRLTRFRTAHSAADVTPRSTSPGAAHAGALARVAARL